MGPAHPDNLDTAAREEHAREELRRDLATKQARKAERLDYGEQRQAAGRDVKFVSILMLLVVVLLVSALTCAKVLGIL